MLRGSLAQGVVENTATVPTTTSSNSKHSEPTKASSGRSAAGAREKVEDHAAQDIPNHASNAAVKPPPAPSRAAARELPPAPPQRQPRAPSPPTPSPPPPPPEKPRLNVVGMLEEGGSLRWVIYISCGYFDLFMPAYLTISITQLEICTLKTFAIQYNIYISLMISLIILHASQGSDFTKFITVSIVNFCDK